MFIWSAMLASSIVAIGDELVGGFTLDTNSHWVAERLRMLGYPVKRATQIRDRPQEIVEQLRRELDDAEITDVFVSGGLGPTPDDRTFAALATALGKELMIWEETRARIERRVQRMPRWDCSNRPTSRKATCAWRASPRALRMCSRIDAVWRPGVSTRRMASG